MPKHRPPAFHPAASQALHFFGRQRELALLDRAVQSYGPSVVAMVGPGGQGKTAIVQHWLAGLRDRALDVEGVFLWSFYRGKDSDLCLRELLAYAEDLSAAPEVSASFCVDRILPILRHERWAIFLDGDARRQRDLTAEREPEASAEEWHVARVLSAFQTRLPQETQDVLALATSFRQPPAEPRLLEYLVSEPVHNLLHEHWGRIYV